MIINKQKNPKPYWCKEIIKIRVKKNVKKKIYYQEDNSNFYTILRNKAKLYQQVVSLLLFGKKIAFSVLLKCSFLANKG